MTAHRRSPAPPDLRAELEATRAREAATRAILEIVSHSHDDEAPVFEAILAHAQRLCRAPVSGLILATPEDAFQRMAAHRNVPQGAVEMFDTDQMPVDGNLSYAARSIVEGRLVQFADMAESDLYRAGSPVVRTMVDRMSIRSVLFVPLLKQGRAIGTITLFRHEVEPFEPRQIELVETFAVQAVIAIEKVRQFHALEELNAGLEERVAAQVEQIERMGRLKRFLPAAVADRVLSRGSETLLRSHRALLGVLFCDIRGFTAFCETAEPEETIEVLKTYHEEMGRLINAHGAGVDHRMGDGIMVLFMIPCPARTRRARPCAWPLPCARRWPRSVPVGSAWAIGWASAWAFLSATRPSAWWAPGGVTTTRPRARRSTSPPGSATRRRTGRSCSARVRRWRWRSALPWRRAAPSASRASAPRWRCSSSPRRSPERRGVAPLLDKSHRL